MNKKRKTWLVVSVLAVLAVVGGVVSLMIESPKGVLEVFSPSSEAEVWIGDDKVGMTTGDALIPFVIKVTEGEHELRLIKKIEGKPGYGYTAKKQIVITEGAIQAVKMSLGGKAVVIDQDLVDAEIKAARENWSDFGDRSRGSTCTVPIASGMKMQWIKPGSFQMGSPSSEENRSSDESQHKVKISKGFWLGRHEVTQAEWRAVVGDSPSQFTGEKNLPVESVSWNDCQRFVKKLNETAKQAGVLKGYKFALPTEAQWEYACRAGTSTVFHYGNSLGSGQANFDGNYPYGGASKGLYKKRTSVVGSYKANAWGLYDMHGNVWEWCNDWYDEAYYNGTQTDPRGPRSGSNRVIRGGSWNYSGENCRSSNRNDDGPSNGYNDMGVRVALVPED